MLHFLKVAAEVADLTTDKHRKACLGAVAIRQDGTLVYSRNGGHPPPNDDKCPSSHAERRVLRKAGYGATVYVSRIKRDGSLAMAKPCARCEAAMRSHRVEMVYYTSGPDTWEGFRP